MNAKLQRIDKYELQQCVAREQRSETWIAIDGYSHQTVILKFLHVNLSMAPNSLSDFEDKVRLIASLHHENIAQLRDFQVPSLTEPGNTGAYLVMDYIDGATLADYMHDTSHAGKFPPAAEIVEIFTSIAVAIDYAHSKGVSHRSIKPTNILLNKHRAMYSPAGEPVLTDFSFAELLNTSTDASKGLSHKSAAYISPEQANGYIGNELSDIYSLGVILYEICTGKQPFEGETASAILMQHISSTPPPPSLINPRVSPALSMVILRCLARDPSARFATASSMVVALAQAFGKPIPERLGQSIYQGDALSEPTYYRPLKSQNLIDNMPFSASLPLTPGLSSPVTMAKATPGVVSQEPPTIVTYSPGTPVPPSSPHRKRRNGFLAAIIIILIMVLIGAGLGTFYLISGGNGKTNSVITTIPIVGQASFISSGQLNNTSSQGINDELLIDLHNIPESAPGKSYYAWLLSDKSQTNLTPILLGALTVNNGKAHFLYPGDQKHTNLLSVTSRFLLTEQDTSSAPAFPTSDHSAWHYYAELSQTPDPQDTVNHYSLLNHLRSLLSEDALIQENGLAGGLDLWLYRNTEKILEWSNSARDDWNNAKTNIPLMRPQFIRILDYLDGVSSVQVDVPPGTPVVVDPHIASVALLGPDEQNPLPVSYLHEIESHLDAIQHSQGITSDKRTLVNQMKTAINNVTIWLQKVHSDAKQLINMDDVQMQQPSTLSLLDEMLTYSLYAYAGRLDPSTNAVQDGVVQVHNDIQQLATLNITRYNGLQ